MRSSTIMSAVAAVVSLMGCSSAARPGVDGAVPSLSVSTSARASTGASATASSPSESASESPSQSSSQSPSQSLRPSPRQDSSAEVPEPAPSIDLPELRRPPQTDGLVLGADVSWPQCPKGMGIPEKRSQGLPMPRPSARFVVLGLTNGPGFTRNPCLAEQVRWVRERRLMAAAYAVTSLPDDAALRQFGDEGPYDAGTRLGLLANAGYQQALFNVATMQRVGLLSPVVWVDVEPVPVFEWSSDEQANAAVVAGAAQGYADAGYAVGTYSTPALWEAVVGSLALGLPEWRAAGTTSRAEALRRCRPDWSFQGGDAVLAQWVADSRDHNTTCPGVGRELARWFHQY